MKIIIKPSDLIERFIWDKYVYFCLNTKNKQEIAEIIEKNEEFQISEEQAFVIGLTCVIYTPNVVHKFKQYIKEIIEHKSFEFENRLHLNKQILIDSARAFKNKIPKNWESTDIEFNLELQKMNDLYDLFIANVNNLLTISIQEWPCVRSGQVKKIINKI